MEAHNSDLNSFDILWYKGIQYSLEQTLQTQTVSNSLQSLFSESDSLVGTLNEDGGGCATGTAAEIIQPQPITTTTTTIIIPTPIRFNKSRESESPLKTATFSSSSSTSSATPTSVRTSTTDIKGKQRAIPPPLKEHKLGIYCGCSSASFHSACRNCHPHFNEIHPDAKCSTSDLYQRSNLDEENDEIMREYYNFLEKERLETQLTDRNLCRVELNSRSLEATSLPADNKPNSIQAISKYESEYSNGIMHTYLTNRDPKNEAHLWLDADWIFPSVFPPPTPPTPKASIWRRAVRSVKKAPAKIKTFLGALNRFRCR